MLNPRNVLVGIVALTLTQAALAKKPAPAPKLVKTPSHYLAESWNYHYYFPFLRKLADIPQQAGSTYEEQIACDRFYSNVKAKGEMKIVMGIGYYDFSEGEEFSFNYREDGSFTDKTHNFGMNATIDLTYDVLYREILTKKCSGTLQLCGFSEVQPGVYVKTVKSPEGQKIRAIVEIKSSSVTPEHATNVGPMKAEQQLKSNQTTQWFFDSFSSADLVVYNGHSRKGGGPDFHPPVLRQDLHVNYAHYDAKKPGLNRLLSALSGSKKPTALLMMSCNSAPLFEKTIKKAAPGMGFAGTNAVIPGDIPNKGAMAGMDAFLKFQCNQGFQTQMQLEADLAQQIKPVSIQ